MAVFCKCNMEGKEMANEMDDFKKTAVEARLREEDELHRRFKPQRVQNALHDLLREKGLTAESVTQEQHAEFVAEADRRADETHDREKDRIRATYVEPEPPEPGRDPTKPRVVQPSRTPER